MTSRTITDEERRSFLDALDDSKDPKVTSKVSKFEADFLEQNIDRLEFTKKQRDVIDRMMDSYAVWLSW